MTTDTAHLKALLEKAKVGVIDLVPETDGTVFILDDNFDHDAGMKVSGDWSTRDQAVEYAKAICAAVNAAPALIAEVDALRETNARLNRRCQSAEAAIPSYEKIKALPPDGDGVRFVNGSLGRALVVAASEKLQADNESLRARLKAAEERVAVLEDITTAWLAFASDVQASDAAGDDWLESLRAKSTAALAQEKPV